VAEATVTRCCNGVAVNFADPYMRRRIIECCPDRGSCADYEAFLPSVDLAP